MNKLDYFVEAMRNKLYSKRVWVRTVFALTKEDNTNDYYLKPKVIDGKYHYVVGNNQTLPIDSEKDKPLYSHKEKVFITNQHCPNLNSKEPVETTYGRLLFNWIVLVNSLGTAIPYQNSKVNINAIEDSIAAKLVDNPKGNESIPDGAISVTQYLNFSNSVFYLAEFSQLFVPAATEKMLTVNPETLKLKEKLLRENKNNLTDKTVVAKIEAELVKHDKETWLKDDPSNGFLIGKKDINVNRKRLMLMYGVEDGLEADKVTEPITNSLSEGIDVERLPDYINTVRVGSYNRGKETQLGGESVKWLLRASSNMAVVKDDCGSTIGIPFKVTETNFKNIIGRYVIENGKSVLLTDESVKSYVNKTITLRSPMFCKLDKTDYCSCCVGSKLSIHKAGLSIAVSDYGSGFMYIAMSAMHSKGLNTTKLNLADKLF